MLPQKATKITISPKRAQPTSEVFTCKEFVVFITSRLKGNFCDHFKYNTSDGEIRKIYSNKKIKQQRKQFKCGLVNLFSKPFQKL